MSHGQPFRSVSRRRALHYGRNTCTIIFFPASFFGAVFPGEKKNMRIHIWHILDSAKLHSMRSWPDIHLVYILDILIFPREIVLDRIDLKAINVWESTWAKTFWQFCFYAWVGLFSLVTNKQINCCQECHSGFTIESRCSGRETSATF